MKRALLFFEATPRDPATGLVTVRICSAAADRMNGPDGAVWQPWIGRAPTISLDVFGPLGTEGANASYGDLTIRVGPGLGNVSWAALEWDGAPCRLWLLTPAGNFMQLLEGRCGPLSMSRAGEAQVALRGPEGDLDRPLLTASYAGTGGAEGEAALRGTLKPWCSGICEAVPGVLVSRVHWVWQVHGYGPIEAVPFAYEQGLSLGAPVADFANYSALVAATLREGQWATCVAEGLVRFGAQPTGVVTFDVQGAREGLNFRVRAAAIAAHVMRARGVPAGKIADASQIAYDAAFNHDYGFYAASQVTVGEAVRKCLSDTLGYLFADGSGVWRFGRLPSAKTAGALNDARSSEPLVQSVSQPAAAPPVGSVKVGGRRCWRVHGEAEISPVLFERGEYDNAAVYRPGNIVTHQGARWTFIGSTPTSGNPPPALPATSNAFWLRIVGQTEWQTVTGAGKPADNATRNVYRGSWASLAVGTAFVLGDEVLDQNALWTPVAAHSKTAGNGPPTLPTTSNATWVLKLESGAGAPGLSVATVTIHNRAATAPAAPTADVTVTFSTGALSGLSGGWQATPYAPADGEKRWTRQAPAAGVGPTAVITPGAWSAAVEFPKDGDNARALRLSASGQAFRFGPHGRADPADQAVTFTAALENISGTVVWTTDPVVTLSGSGLTRTLSVADFGHHGAVKVTAALGGLSDSITVVRLQANDGSNLLDVSPWRPGLVGTVGRFTEVSSVAGESSIVSGFLAGSSSLEPLWLSRPLDPGAFPGGMQDGGWVYDQIPVSPDKGYRFSVWFRLDDNAAPDTSGLVFLGCGGAVQWHDGSGWVDETNPYFMASVKSSFTAGRWYLAVGYLHSRHHTGVASQGRVYDTEGREVGNLLDFRSKAGGVLQVHRAFLFYSGNSQQCYWARPRVDEISGAEPSVFDLLRVSPALAARALQGYLTNEAHAVPADAAGNVTSFTGASGSMRVFYGGVDVSASCTFTVQDNAAGLTTTIGGAGAYSVTAEGSWPTASRVATVTYRASYLAPGGATVTLDRVLTLTKSNAGPQGPNGPQGPQGPNGPQGPTGATGVSTRTVFRRSATQPATPSPSAGTPTDWYASTGDVPAGSGPMWASTGERPAGGTNYTWGSAVRHEAVTAVSTGDWAYLTESVSPEMTFTLADGESRVVRGVGLYPSPVSPGSVRVQIEYSEVGGSWTASNGPSAPFNVGEPGAPAHQVTVTNSTGRLRPFRVRGTLIVEAGNPGARDANVSVLTV